jgi:hypothetical protein
MERSRGLRGSIARRATRVAAAVGLALGGLLPLASPTLAADVSLEARTMLGGHVRPGAWTAISVTVRNDGPTIDGELRISGPQQGRSTYGIPVQLANGAIQTHTLYAQPSFFGTKFAVSLVDASGTPVARQELRVTSHDPSQPIIGVIAERPNGIIGDIKAAATSPNATPVVVQLTTADLPPRVEAWSAIDRLIWQDVDSGALSDEQRSALETWVGAGGRLVILGGTTGTTTLGAFPAELLPFIPVRTTDATREELAALVGAVPEAPASAPALAGTLLRGSVLARSGDDVIGAETAHGQGSVSLVGFDPSADWLADTRHATAFWKRLLPNIAAGVVNPLSLPDDTAIVGALNNLPAVDLPRIEQLFLLLFGYVALIGPVNYLVLKRLDRREWAWLTMPLLVIVFAVAAYSLGLVLKGTDVIVNQLAIVRGAAGADRGLAQAYVGVFSPTRETFEISVAGGAFLTNPISQQQQQAEQPLDVVFGESARLRGYGVGFGVLRSFRAETAVTTPRIESDLRFTGGNLEGTITNRSDVTLENVAVVYGGGVATVPRLAPGEATDISFSSVSAVNFGLPLSERMFGQAPNDPASARTTYSRRTIIDQLTGYSWKIGNGALSDRPMILAFHAGAAVDVDVAGTEVQRAGDTLYVLPAPITIEGHTVIGDEFIRRSVIDADANEAFDQGNNTFSLGRGTMTVEFRPTSFSGGFAVSSLELGMSQGEGAMLRGRGDELAPLPDAEQPDQDDPVDGPTATDEGSGPGDVTDDTGEVVEGDDLDALPGPMEVDGIPDLQLFDLEAARWVEFPHLRMGAAYLVDDPARYVDGSGSLTVRFVNRQNQGMVAYFGLSVRLEGTVG